MPGVAALLLIIGGTPCRPKAHVTLAAPRLEAAGSPDVQQEPSQQGRSQQVPPPGEAPPLTKKQKKDLLKGNFEKMKRDADELAELAKSLQEDLDQSNENVLSLRVIDKAEKIEKLAKRIKGTARGY